MKRWNSVAAVVALIMILAACGGESGSGHGSTSHDDGRRC
jgi:hypothetical protein